MSWKFQPFVMWQRKADEGYSGPVVAGLKMVLAPNERGIVLYVGPWLFQLTFLRDPWWVRCTACDGFHPENNLCLWY